MADEPQELSLTQAKAQWESKTLGKVLSRFPERQSQFATSSGHSVERVYGPDDITAMDYGRDLGFPGDFPYTRGVQPTMYRSRFWTMRQYAGFGSAEETNARFRYLLAQGQTGLSIAFDLPTQMGYDSDHPLADGEVGRVGVAASNVADLEVLFDGIPLDQVTTSMTINAPATVLLAMYLVVAAKQGLEPAKLGGTVQNDVLKEYVARGTYIFPPRPSMRLVTDLFAYCSAEMPNWNTISISGYHIREAGATAVQEVAFTLANAMAYVKAAMDQGLDVDTFAPRLSFFFNSHTNFLEEIAKFRAARRLWARIMREEFGAKDPRSLMLRFHTQTAGSTLTAQQPENNIVRVALQALAAVLGGTQSLHTNSKDEALALPTEAAVRTALRTQQIIAYESGVADSIDPLAGSYMIEALTNQIELDARAYIQRLLDLGGAVAAIEQGYMQREILEAAYRHQREIESKQVTIVGVNAFTTQEKPPEGLLRVDPAVEVSQRERLAAARAARDGSLVGEALAGVRAVASGDGNMMPPIIAAVRAGATLGEVCGVMREVFGEYRAPSVV